MLVSKDLAAYSKTWRWCISIVVASWLLIAHHTLGPLSAVDIQPSVNGRLAWSCPLFRYLKFIQLSRSPNVSRLASTSPALAEQMNNIKGDCLPSHPKLVKLYRPGRCRQLAAHCSELSTVERITVQSCKIEDHGHRAAFSSENWNAVAKGRNRSLWWAR